jgi:hypothetical protein
MRSRIAQIAQSSALSLFLFFTSFYYLTNAGDSKIGDEIFMIQVARKIVEQGQIGFHEEKIISVAYWEDFAAKGPDGHYYLKWGLGQSLVEVPFLLLHRSVWKILGPEDSPGDKTPLFLSEFVFLILCPSMISALGCVIFFWFGLRVGYSNRVAVFLTLLYGLGTMVWPYSKSFMSEATLNVAILGCAYGATEYTRGHRAIWLVISGTCIGFALITKLTSLVVLPVILSYVLVSVNWRKSVPALLVWLLPPFVVFLGVQALHNLIRYGKVWEMGYDAGWGVLGFCTPLLVGLWGLLASPGKSFFLYAPITLLGVVYLMPFIRKRKKEAFLVIGISMLFLLLHARWCLWAGDWAWGPRFLLVLTPYLVLPCGVVFERWSQLTRVKRFIVSALLILSVGIQFLGVSVHPFSYIETREKVINQLLSPEMPVLSYKRSYSEGALTQFSPLFSHIYGNWWLFKHMIFSYDLWSDAPWRVIGDFDLPPPIWVIGNRAIPFWWPVSLPLFSQKTGPWVYPLAITSFLALVWGGIRVARILRAKEEE